MVSDRVIEKWVKLVNKEYHREDRNEFTIEYFKKLNQLPCCHFESHRDWYLVVIFAPDMWGDKTMSLVSCYARGNKAVNFLKIQRRIEQLAKANLVSYTIQGSHLNERYTKFLSGIGYKLSDMKKEYNNGK